MTKWRVVRVGVVVSSLALAASFLVAGCVGLPESAPTARPISVRIDDSLNIEETTLSGTGRLLVNASYMATASIGRDDLIEFVIEPMVEPGAFTLAGTVLVIRIVGASPDSLSATAFVVAFTDVGSLDDPTSPYAPGYAETVAASGGNLTLAPLDRTPGPQTVNRGQFAFRTRRGSLTGSFITTGVGPPDALQEPDDTPPTTLAVTIDPDLRVGDAQLRNQPNAGGLLDLSLDTVALATEFASNDRSEVTVVIDTGDSFFGGALVAIRIHDADSAAIRADAILVAYGASPAVRGSCASSPYVPDGACSREFPASDGELTLRHFYDTSDDEPVNCGLFRIETELGTVRGMFTTPGLAACEPEPISVEIDPSLEVAGSFLTGSLSTLSYAATATCLATPDEGIEIRLDPDPPPGTAVLGGTVVVIRIRGAAPAALSARALVVQFTDAGYLGCTLNEYSHGQCAAVVPVLTGSITMQSYSAMDGDDAVNSGSFTFQTSFGSAHGSFIATGIAGCE